MNTLPLLMKREYWEHRGGFLWTPVWTCAVILVVTLAGIVTAEILGQRADVHIGISLSALHADMSAQDVIAAGNALDLAQVMFGFVTCIALFFVLFFYLLGALYDDRRDRSVLFWKSLPVTDTATVAAKALCAAFLAPLIAFVVSTIAYVVFLAMAVAWAALHGFNALPAVAAAHPLGMFLRLLLTIPVDALWALPTIGWLLFWSAWVRSKPFLWAVMLPLGAIFLNGWFSMLNLPHLTGAAELKDIGARLLLSIMPGGWLGSEGGFRFHFDEDNVMAMFDPAHVYALLATPGLWIGAVAGLALLAAAVWSRGRRIETSA